MPSHWPLVKRWTTEEHERLKEMASRGKRPDEIAAALQRTEKAVRARAWQHGIALGKVHP
jgi:DNA-binding NarL/FixJ family response regulator